MRNTPADDAAVLNTIADIREAINGLRFDGVYEPNGADRELIPAEVAASKLGIETKRLLGYGLRNKVGDPIGGLIDGKVYFYAWSLEPLRKRLAVRGSAATNARPVSSSLTSDKG